MSVTRLPFEPHGIGFGAGRAWIADYHGERLFSVDGATGRLAGEGIVLPFAPEWVAVTQHAAWVTPATGGWAARPDRRIARIDARTREVDIIELPARPRDVAADRDVVWVATEAPHGLLRVR